MHEPDFKPPVAAIRPHSVASPQGVRVDPYYWLRDDERTNPEVLAYLNAKNAYRERSMISAPLAIESTSSTSTYRYRGRARRDDSQPATRVSESGPRLSSAG